MRGVRRAAATIAVAGIVAATTPTAGANQVSATLSARAVAETYSLDRERALATYRQAVAADPKDARALRGLASTLWLSITFRRGNMTVDDYLGRVNRPGAATNQTPPPPETVTAFNEALDRAVALCRERIAANPHDVNAHYELGAALGLRASYIATVEGSALGAFRAARAAYEEHEIVLGLDPSRKDAGLIVGTYRYVVSALALPLRWVAYIAGFGGDRERGVQMIEEAASYGGDNVDDARFALVLIYNREGRYEKALALLGLLRDRYPRNRLIWLESGATSLRAGRPADADRVISDGLTRFTDDLRPRMFGEDALWYHKRGTARARLGRPPEAELDLTKAISLEGRAWVHGRSHLELGRLALAGGRRAAARRALEQAITLCESDNDATSAEEAKRLLKSRRAASGPD